MNAAKTLVLIGLLAWCGLLTPLATGAEDGALRALTGDGSAFHRALSDRINRVREFHFIRKEAEMAGVRAFLFGGTAAAFAHYVAWHLRSESGTGLLPPEHFDYFLQSIYKPSQDFDIVLDGPADWSITKLAGIAEELQATLESRFPYRRGRNSAWEVRLLRHYWNKKEALVDNWDFAHQNTDSQSTGLVEITETPGQPSVLDLRDWGRTPCRFLGDVVHREIGFYYSSDHARTSRAKRGENPPILGAVRYLAKASQYDLRPYEDDLRAISAIVKHFDPEYIPPGYVRFRLEQEARKIFESTANLERAWELIDRVGIRAKLAGLSPSDGQDSLGFWLSKKVLTSFAVGQGEGRTADELGIDVVSHETTSFKTYEQIGNTFTGYPNAFISRPNTPGEAAQYGEGFYTKRGRLGERRGGKRSGFTLRFQIDPRAREGYDFEYDRATQYVVIKNRAAIRLLPESLRVSDPGEFFDLLAEGDRKKSGNTGLFERWRRRSRPDGSALDDSMRGRLSTLAESVITGGTANVPFIVEWLLLPFSGRVETIPQRLAEQPYEVKRDIFLDLFETTGRDILAVMKTLKRNGLLESFADYPQSYLDAGPWERTLISGVEELIQAGFRKADLDHAAETAIFRTNLRERFNEKVTELLVPVALEDIDPEKLEPHLRYLKGLKVRGDVNGIRQLVRHARLPVSEQIELARKALEATQTADDVLSVSRLYHNALLTAADTREWHEFIEMEAVPTLAKLDPSPETRRRFAAGAARTEAFREFLEGRLARATCGHGLAALGGA